MRSNDDFKAAVFSRCEEYKREKRKRIKRAVLTGVPCLSAAVIILSVVLMSGGGRLKNFSIYGNVEEKGNCYENAPSGTEENDYVAGLYGLDYSSNGTALPEKIEITRYENEAEAEKSELTAPDKVAEIVKFLKDSIDADNGEILDSEYAGTETKKPAKEQRVKYRVDLCFDEEQYEFFIYENGTVSIGGKEWTADKSEKSFEEVLKSIDPLS